MNSHHFNDIPLALYIHLPWCVKKCPYCDFNSHPLTTLPEDAYIESLIQDFEADRPYVQNRNITSIFFGGGTPSLFSPKSLAKLLTHINQHLNFNKNLEITLEANPGTAECHNFKDYKAIGINRISLGAQSFNDAMLQRLGRIHSSLETYKAVTAIEKAGFEAFNLDIMYGLPEQTLAGALEDLTAALSLNPAHLSWYHLTLEPNTRFFHSPPTLPNEEVLLEMMQQGQSLIQNHGLKQYEVSAYAFSHSQCQHNLNYWQFGDYLGIGAGAHGKISLQSDQSIMRLSKKRHPKAYMENTGSFIDEQRYLTTEQLPFEFMLNLLRLNQGFDLQLFEARTGLNRSVLSKALEQGSRQGLILHNDSQITLTDLGWRFLNDTVALFLS